MPRRSSCTSASRSLPPPLPHSFFPRFCLFFFCCCCCCVPLLFIYFSSSPTLCCRHRRRFRLGATEEATAPLTRCSGHKDGATAKQRDRTQLLGKILAYPRGIPTKLIANEPDPPTPLPLLSIFTPLTLTPPSLADLSRGVTPSYSLICVNPCFRQHVGRRLTPPSDIGGPVLPPDSTTPVHWLRLVTQSECASKRERGAEEEEDKKINK